MESREDLIKNHYMARIAELTSQLQLADSKSVHFYAEVSGVDKIATSPTPSSRASLLVLFFCCWERCHHQRAFCPPVSGSVVANGDQFIRHSSTFISVSVRRHASFPGSCKRDDRLVQPFCGPVL